MTFPTLFFPEKAVLICGWLVLVCVWGFPQKAIFFFPRRLFSRQNFATVMFLLGFWFFWVFLVVVVVFSPAQHCILLLRFYYLFYCYFVSLICTNRGFFGVFFS